jgi:hypothetical protein
MSKFFNRSLLGPKNKNGNLPVRLYLEAEKELMYGRETNTLTEKTEDYLLDAMEYLWYHLTNEQKEAANSRASQYHNTYINNKD